MALPSCDILPFQKGTGVATGIGFLDHMLDQFYSHAQIGLQFAIIPEGADSNCNADTLDQAELLRNVGTAVGCALQKYLSDVVVLGGTSGRSSTFSCPLDEALVTCVIERSNNDEPGSLQSYTLAPFGCFPKTGRTKLGHLQTSAIEEFWKALAQNAHLHIRLEKIRGRNAHHICESSFKAFARSLRNYVDNIDCVNPSCDETSSLQKRYGSKSENHDASAQLARQGSVERQTKETTISVQLKLDGGTTGIRIDTGVKTLDTFYKTFAASAGLSLEIHCRGDLHIDEHHTTEDVSIALGQALTQALGSKAGANRMWCASSNGLDVTMDLSNRPCFIHNMEMTTEMVGQDLSAEMLEHVLESIVSNGRMTVHVLVQEGYDYKNVVIDTAKALGHALRYCSIVDGRRAGATASSKGTLSV